MIIDTHTHFYDPSRPEGIPWPTKDNEPLYRTVLPEHFKAVANPCGVTHTVIVEASAWLEDNDWILEMAKDEPAIAGFVGHLEPEWDGFDDHAARLGANPLFNGIRLHRGTFGDGKNDQQQALRSLVDHNLELDLLVNAEELPAVANAATAYPSLRIVVNHVAHVSITGRDPDPAWIEALRSLAPHENVFMKISGFIECAETQPAPDDPAYYKPTFDAMWNILGEDRLVYGSNWPVCERAGPYETVFKIADAYFTSKGEAAREKYFVGNSRKAYRLAGR